ncbi:MAG: pilus assembly protein PilM [Planctomycetota bacterium]
MATTSWGIDIGNRALKAVKLVRGPEGVVIDDFAFIEHDTILSEAGDNRESLIETALARFVGRHNVKGVEVNVGVSGQQSFARFVKLPPVEPKKVPEIVRFEAVQQIPFPLDEVEWSYQLFERDDDPDVEVGIFAMRKELVSEFVEDFIAVDLDVSAVQTVPLATYNAMRYESRLDKGHAVILDLGASSCEMIIADADSIWMRSLDIGGNTFTEALAKAFKIDFEKAEEMKRTAKTSKYAKQIYQAMRPVFGDLVSEVQRSIGYYSSSHRDTKLRKIICTGGGFKLNGLSGYLQKNLQMPVEKPTKFRSRAPEGAEPAAELSEHTLSATAAYGLALQVLDEAKVASSLLPTNIKQDKMWKDKTKWFMLAGGLCAGALLLSYGSYFFNSAAYANNADERQTINSVKSELETNDRDWSAVTSDGQAELRQVQNVNVLVQDREYWGKMIADIVAALPSPPEEYAEAIAGGLGDPTTIDEADKAKMASLERDQRKWVELLSLQSIYSDDLYAIANDSEVFFAQAESVMGKSSRNKFEGLLAASPFTAGADDVLTVENEKARGYIMRAVMVTPLDVDAAQSAFSYQGGNSIPRQLEELVRPTASNPNLPYQVVIADVRRFDPLNEDSEQVERLRELYEAKLAVEVDVEEEQAEQPARRRGNRADRSNRTDRGNDRGRNDRGRTNRDRDSRGGPAPGFPGGEFNPYGGGFPLGQRGGGLGRPTGPVVSADDESPAFVDPVTGDSMLDYTVIEIVFAVLLDPPEYQSGPSGESETDDELPEEMAEAG